MLNLTHKSPRRDLTSNIYKLINQVILHKKMQLIRNSEIIIFKYAHLHDYFSILRVILYLRRQEVPRLRGM